MKVHRSSSSAHTFVHVSYYEHPRREVFGAHLGPDLFSVLTPPGMGVVTIPLTNGLNPGSEVVLRVSHPLLSRFLPNIALPGAGVGPVGLPWRVRHTKLEPPELFEDVQVSGPFAHWRHRHIFSEVETGERTRITDIVNWGLPLALRPAAPIVRRELRKLFGYRERALREFLG